MKGRLVLGGFSLSFGTADDEFEWLADETRVLEARHAELLGEEAALLEELARIYLPDLSPESVGAGIGDLRARLRRAREEQERRRAVIDADIEGAAERVRIRAEAVEKAEAAVAALDARVAEARARVEATLRADDGHAARVAEHEAVMALRELLKRRRARLLAAATAERHRYEGDACFRYLESRRWGEDGYRPGFGAARLDAWLARRIDYDRLRRSYRILLTGPHQIQAEIRRLEGRAAELEGELDRRDGEVAAAEGMLPLLEERASLVARVEETRRDLAAARETESSLRAERRALETDRGKHHEEAIELHRQYLKGRTFVQLDELARSTADPRDDTLVLKLERVRCEIGSLERSLESLLGDLREGARKADRLSELERVGLERHAAAHGLVPGGPGGLGGAGGGTGGGGVKVEVDAAHPDLVAFMAGELTAGEVLDRLQAAAEGGTTVVEVPEPYFESLYREMAAAFDASVAGAVAVDAGVEAGDGDSGSEVVVHGPGGRVISRRVTPRRVG